MNPAQDYILNKPEPFRSILLEVSAIIEASVKGAELKYKWRLPCYYINNKPFCYLNQTKGYVDLGFWHARHIRVHQDQLISENRTLIKSLRYRTLEEIDHKVLQEVLEDAYSHKDKGLYS